MKTVKAIGLSILALLALYAFRVAFRGTLASLHLPMWVLIGIPVAIVAGYVGWLAWDAFAGPRRTAAWQAKEGIAPIGLPPTKGRPFEKS